MGKDPLSLGMKLLKNNERISRIQLGPVAIHFLFHPSDLKRVLTTEAEHYRKTSRGYELVRHLLGDGLLTSEGDFWRRQRRIAQPAFRRDCIAAFVQTMLEHTKARAGRWKTAAHNDGEINLSEELMALTLAVAGETLMSIDTTDESNDFASAISIFLEGFNALAISPLPWAEYWPTVANRKMWRAIQTLHAHTEKIIQARRENGAVVTDLLGLFLAAEDPEPGVKMNDRQLRDEVLTMLVAGHETTANALIWTLYLLAQHTHVTERLESEIESVLRGRDVAVSDMKNLCYTQQVIKESLRLYPPAWTVVRQAASDRELAGYKIPKGSYVFVSPYIMHHHPSYWDMPEAFDPDRFRKGADEVDRYVYFPFLRGQRQCIGDRFAEMELTVMLVTLLQRYRFSLPANHTVEIDPSYPASYAA